MPNLFMLLMDCRGDFYTSHTRSFPDLSAEIIFFPVSDAMQVMGCSATVRMCNAAFVLRDSVVSSASKMRWETLTAKRTCSSRCRL